MNLIKIITIFNWIVIGLLTYLVAAEAIFPAKGGDAAGRGMGQAIYYLSIVALVVLLILNFLPYKATKYTAFALVLIPILYVQIAPYWRDLQRGMQSRRDAAKPIFEDKERDQIARAIDNGDPEKLKKYLETTPVAKLNEDGNLLAYAINATNSTAYKNRMHPHFISGRCTIRQHTRRRSTYLFFGSGDRQRNLVKDLARTRRRCQCSAILFQTTHHF
jgi:hypothetical protein